MPSHSENLGLVVAEALGSGKPVLISNKVNIWREIEADTAEYVDNDTAKGTVRNLRRWLALDADDDVDMSARAQRCFASPVSIRRVAQRLAEILEE